MNLNKIKAKLEALKSLRDNASTEAEALNAAEKIADILAKYNLDLTEEEFGEDPYGDAFIGIGSKTWRNYFNGLTAGVADLCGVIHYRSTRNAGAGVIYFGRKHEVEAAQYLHTILVNALDRAINNFRNEVGYLNLPNAVMKRTALNSFRVGMSIRLGERLQEMAAARRPKGDEPGLVYVGKSALTQALRDRGVRLRSGRHSRFNLDGAAYSNGKAAGDSVALNKGVGRGQNSRGQFLLC